MSLEMLRRNVGEQRDRLLSLTWRLRVASVDADQLARDVGLAIAAIDDLILKTATAQDLDEAEQRLLQADGEEERTREQRQRALLRDLHASRS